MDAIIAASTKERSFQSAWSQIGPASSWVTETCLGLGVPQGAIIKLDACMNEVFANILTHGGADALAAQIRLHLSIQPGIAEQAVTLTISDKGIPFDATRCAVRSPASSLADVQPGGLGIILLRANADDLLYSYHERENRLAVTVRWQSA